MSMVGIDYRAIARQYGVNDDKKAKRLYAKAMDITRKLAGDIPQNKLEKEFPKELMDNYQDLLQHSSDQNYRESVNRVHEAMSTRDAVKLMGEIVKIEIPFAEGITGRYADGKVFSNVAEAQKFFNSIPMDDSPGYDKVQTLITFSDGLTLKNFRFDRNPKAVFSADLLGYLERYVTLDESTTQNKENSSMKNKTKIREYLENDMPLDELIAKYDLEEEESYSQAMINPNTKDYKGKKKDEDCGKSQHRKEYADKDGDLAGTNGYGASYADEGSNAYGTEDDKQEIIDAETAIDTNDNESVE